MSRPAQSRPSPALVRSSLPAAVLLVVAILVALGLAVMASAVQGSSGVPYLSKQALWLVIGVSAGFVAMKTPLPWLQKLAWPIGLLSLGLLALVLIPGIGLEINGARRWLSLGPLRMQPSDPARLALVVLLASYLSQFQRERRTFLKGFCVPMVLIGLFAGLTFLEPDFGTAFLLALVGCSLLFLAGTPLLYMVPVVILGLVGFAAAVKFDPIRLERITSFLDVENTRTDGGYQLWQGLVAFGSGGVEGVGLGQGRQQLSYLPEAHTDFIFPVIGEELGFWATAGVAGLFALLFVLVVSHLHRAQTLFQYLLVWGGLLFITFQALINMGVTTGLLPTKGMSLPFISYGGSNLVTLCVLVGLILNALGVWQRPITLRAREL